jgi:hypothetical protein
MRTKFKSASRLSIVFILAVVISGSILTYFSINNISNLKELTEKKIIEEERELFYRLQDSIQTKIDDLTKGFSVEFSTFSFILNKSGDFVFPNFIQLQETRKTGKSSNRYVVNFEEGVKAEFIN